MNKKAIVCVTNDLSTDQRVQKHCFTLMDKGYEVILIGRVLPDSLSLNFPFKSKRFKLWVNKGALFYAFYNIRLFIYLLFNKCNLIFSNDLDTLPACYLASKLKKTNILYDSHEYFLGVPEIQNKKLVKSVWSFFERTILPRLNHFITVNPSIASLYKKSYGLKPSIIRNIPSSQNFPKHIKTRDDLQLPADAFIVILQGSGININRGAEEFILSMKYTESNLFALIIGKGDVWNKLIEIIKENDLHNKVRLIERLPYPEMIQYTLNSNIGVTLDKPGNSNYENSLPNKIFDYAFSGLPVLGSNIKEVSKVINEYQIGSVIDSVNPESIANALNYFFLNKSFYNFCKQNTLILKEKLSWEKESEKLTEILSKLD